MTNPEVPTRKSIPYKEILMERLADEDEAIEYIIAAYEDSRDALRKAITNVAEAYHAHKNQGLAEKAAEEIWNAVFNDEKFLASKESFAAIIASCIERNGQ